MITYYNLNYSFSRADQHRFGLYEDVGCKNPADEPKFNYEEMYGEEWYEEDEPYNDDKFYKKVDKLK
jgi:hypothetical protein